MKLGHRSLSVSSITLLGRSISFQATRQWLFAGHQHSAAGQAGSGRVAGNRATNPAFRWRSLISVQEKKKRWDTAITGPEREVLEAFVNPAGRKEKVAREVILALALSARTA